MILHHLGQVCLLASDRCGAPCGQPATSYGVIRARRVYFPVCAAHQQEMLDSSYLTDEDFVRTSEEAEFLIFFQTRCTCTFCQKIEVVH